MNIEKARDFWSLSSKKGLLQAALELELTRDELCHLWSKAMREDREALVFFWNKLCEVYNVLRDMRENLSEIELEYAITTIEQVVDPESFNHTKEAEAPMNRWVRTSARPTQETGYSASLSLSKELMLKVRDRVDSEREDLLAEADRY